MGHAENSMGELRKYNIEQNKPGTKENILEDIYIKVKNFIYGVKN